MTWVAGVDGCKGGWFVVLRNIQTRALSHHVVNEVSELMGLAENPQVIAIDIPIGLLDKAEHGGRACDRAARKLLGQPRGASVFSPPVRCCLSCTDYLSAKNASRESSGAGISLSRQAFALIPKIREVDEWIKPNMQERIREIHPELSFRALNKECPMRQGKKKRAGLEEREGLLVNEGFGGLIEQTKPIPHKRVAPDDVLDACAACWSAGRILKKEVVCIPNSPPIDSRGLRMEMWY